jgi:hypothetical protein
MRDWTEAVTRKASSSVPEVHRTLGAADEVPEAKHRHPRENATGSLDCDRRLSRACASATCPNKRRAARGGLTLRKNHLRPVKLVHAVPSRTPNVQHG